MTTLVVDCNNLLARSFHAMPPMMHKGVRTEAIYGFFRTMVDLQDRFDTGRCVFCFDFGKPKRMNLLPSYKESRETSRQKAEGTDRANEYLRGQCYRLREDILPAIGYRNVLAIDGYEADDLAAATILQLTEEAVIVSSDKDFYQLLENRWVGQWCPAKKQSMSAADFHSKWGIEPSEWPRVKAMAGCVSDCIPGIPGIGELTAAKYIRGELKKDSAAYKKIMLGIPQMTKNLKLVKLPLDGTPEIDLKKDRATQAKYIEACVSLGFKPSRMGVIHE